MICHSVASLKLNAGGPSRSVSQLCEALVKKNESTCIITASDANEPIVDLDSSVYLKKSCAGFSLRSFFPSSNEFSTALHEINVKKNIRLVHQHGIWLRSSHLTSQVAHANSIPLVVAPRGMLEPWALNKSKWKKKLAWAMYQKRDLNLATAFHATAHSEANSIRRLGFKQPVAVIPNGVKLPVLKPEVPKLKPTKTKTRQALFLSRINPKKGLPMFLDTWAQVAPENWNLVIAGNDDSDHLPLVVRKIKQLGLSDRVEVVGPLFGKDKEQAYLNSNLFVLPSYSENFGIVVAEALSYGLPVLTTTGCPWEALEIERCGWWVEPTPDGIKTGLKAAFKSSDDERLEMGKRGRALVERCYLWPAIADKMIDFYNWLLGKSDKPDFVV